MSPTPKVCAKTGVVFCGATKDEVAPETETRLLKAWNTKQQPVMTGGNAAAAASVEEEELH